MASRGVKRNRRGDPRRQHSQRDKEQPVVDESSPIIQAFRTYQVELDSRHDKYERLVKLSRDVTIESKRTIFLLHRTGGDVDVQLKEAEDKLAEIERTKWKFVAAELNCEDPYRFLRAYSPGLQEYIEALSFLYYMKHKELIPLSEVERRLQFTEDEEMPIAETANEMAPTPRATSSGLISVHVPPSDYMLGVADLTGEMMRLAITSVGKGDLELPFQLCQFLRQVLDAFVSFSNTCRELSRKLWTLKQSVQKVENACYTLQVRGSEIPKHMLADIFNTKPSKVNSEDDVSQLDDP